MARWGYARLPDAHEVRKALERERREKRDIVIPVMLDHFLLDSWASGMASDLRSRLGADFKGWKRSPAVFERELDRIMAAVRPLPT